MIRTYLGIELGAEQINAALIDERHTLVALGTYAWESTLENGVWTYPLEELWKGLRSAVGQVLGAVKESVSIEGIGVSGMMHGYMPFDGEGNLLSPYRSARNDFPARASRELTALFGRNIPRRWSIAHLYHAVYSEEAHVRDIRRVCTLACYVHARLTGEFVAGIGEAVGMFPLDGDRYDPRCVAQFAEITSEYSLPWALPDVLPGIRKAGEYAGVLTGDGARLLDSTGKLKAGIPFAPPEGDAGTEMVAANSIAPRTGHVSANRNIVSMTVLEKPLSRAYPEIDALATPTGLPAARVLCNNCIDDLDAWAKTYLEFCGVVGANLTQDELLTKLYGESMKGDPDCGGVTVVGYLAGEHVTDFEEGCPLVLRSMNGRFTLANFLRAQMYSAFASLAIGMRILSRENVPIDRLMGHGALFDVPGIGQQMLADAINAPVTVMKTGVEKGAYGMALLAAYRVKRNDGETLEAYLENRVFTDDRQIVLAPNEEGVCGFAAYLARFERALRVERTAIAENFPKIN